MQVVEQLRPYGLTLQNYASIREQSIGGFTQVRSALWVLAPTLALVDCVFTVFVLVSSMEVILFEHSRTCSTILVLTCSDICQMIHLF